MPIVHVNLSCYSLIPCQVSQPAWRCRGYADYIDSRNQGNRKLATIEAASLFEQNEGSGEIIDLLRGFGINDNSHLMMQSTNNEFIFDLILDWIEEKAGVPKKPAKMGQKNRRQSWSERTINPKKVSRHHLPVIQPAAS